ncbi:MAG: hypothetical protein RL661_416, partial [Pseudomonadota bacterium]
MSEEQSRFEELQAAWLYRQIASREKNRTMR